LPVPPVVSTVIHALSPPTSVVETGQVWPPLLDWNSVSVVPLG
jgi:hypothetical protein